ncbi:MAG: galactonate dehydratase [Candidatus Thalassarchaeaceae archaeon]|nr:galactonate dehydratase [Candidatus Thalassarchaeaceae archaeon]
MSTIRSACCVRCPPRWLLLRVETEDGAVGWGEAIGDLHEEVENALNALGERVEGASIHDITRTIEVLRKSRFWRDGPIMDTAISALEMAMWDLKGQELGAPIHELLGGRVRDKVRVYRNLWGRNPEEFANSAIEAISQSMTAVKVSPAGPTQGIVSRNSLQEMVDVVQAVRDAVGSHIDLAVDLHGRLTPAASRRAIHALSPYDLFFIEEPCLPDGSASHIADLRALRTAQPVAIATGERLRSPHSFATHILPNPVIDIIQPDVSMVGGIRSTIEIGAMASAAQISLAPHCPYGPIQFAASMQIAATSPAHLIQEFQSLGGAGQGGGSPGGGQNWAFELLERPFEIQAGYVEIPTGPGLDVRIQEDRIDEHMDMWNPHPPSVWSHPDGSHAEW